MAKVLDSDETVDTILQAMDTFQVFSVSRRSDGRFEIWEECDRYYSIELSKDQLLMLADALTNLAHQTTLPT